MLLWSVFVFYFGNQQPLLNRNMAWQHGMNITYNENILFYFYKPFVNNKA